MRGAFPQVPSPLPSRVLRTSSYTLEEIRRYTMPKGNLGQFLRPEMDYDAYRERYLAGPLGIVRERVEQMTAELDRAIRAATRGAAREGTSQRDRQEGAEVPARETVGVTEAPEWSVWVSTPDGEEGALEIPRPPSGLRPLQRPAAYELAQTLYEQNRGMSVLLRRLMAGTRVPLRRADDIAPPVALVLPLSTVAPAPVTRKRKHDEAGGSGTLFVHLGCSKNAQFGLDEEVTFAETVTPEAEGLRR